MYVFLTGATGYIGSTVADSLMARGHSVLGLARSDDSAAVLRARGIDVHRGDLSEPESLSDAVDRTDGVVHAGAAMTETMDRGEIDRQAVQTMVDRLSGTGKPFLYTSDQLIYGPTGEDIATEETPLNPPPFVAWRPAVEEIVLDAVDDVRGLVIRPVAVYGHDGGSIEMFVEMAHENGAAYYVGDGEAEWSTIHVEDLAELYVRMLEDAPAGTLLNASSEPPVVMHELMDAVGDAAGVPAESLAPEEARDVMGPNMPVEMFTTNLRVSAAKARELLDWEPTQPSVLEILRAKAKAEPSRAGGE